MARHRFFKKLPTPQQLLENRMLRPLRPYLHHPFLWQFNRRAVAGGVAVGLFFGLLIPFGQIPAAAIVAIILRVNLPVAAFSTLITNPFTFPAVYYIAYKLGDFLTGAHSIVPEVAIHADIEKTVEAQAQVGNWFSNFIDWLSSVGMPLAVGLSVLAIVCSVSGYFVVNWIWRWRTMRHWRNRHHSVKS